jgi:HTH-type transcriptional regulator, competence development regulator
MVAQKSLFGELCRKFRSRDRLFLADQAEALGVSVSLISAIELGKRTAPPGYSEKFAAWLNLNESEKHQLVSSLAASSNIIQFRPKNQETAKFAFELARRLNSMSHAELDRIREALERGEKIYE